MNVCLLRSVYKCRYGHMKILLALSILLTSCGSKFIKDFQEATNRKSRESQIVFDDGSFDSIVQCKKELKERTEKLDRKCDLVVYIAKMDEKETLDACLKTSTKKECTQIFKDMVSARMTLEYPDADYARAGLWCKANPIECDLKTIEGLAAFELQVFETQKQAVNRQRQARQAAEAQRQDRALSQALQAFSDGFKRPAAVNCTSTQYGDTTRTNCY